MRLSQVGRLCSLFYPARIVLLVPLRLSAGAIGIRLYASGGGTAGDFFTPPRKQPPVLNRTQAKRSHRSSEAASQRAQASIRSRNHQIETEMQPG